MCLPQIQKLAYHDYQGRQADADAQHAADGDFHFQISFSGHPITTFP
jgi:hypothetical protein